ncbi:MAG: hypothetical protein QOF25_561 [Mycobacterium sp.]|nr:hypothetical protein [Mycobacterium sp.]
MAALTSGEQHPLAAIVVEYGAALLSLIRAMANSDDADSADGGARAGDSEQRSKAPGRYQPIAITIHECRPPAGCHRVAADG